MISKKPTSGPGFRAGAWSSLLAALALAFAAPCPSAEPAAALAQEKGTPAATALEDRAVGARSLPSASETAAAVTAAAIRVPGTGAADATKPVRLQGVVTFAHAAQQTFYVSDQTGGVLVWLPDPQAPLPPPGARVTVTGTIAPGPLSRTLRASAAVVTGQAGFPPAQATTFEQGMAGTADAQWVEARGLLRHIEVLESWVRLTLDTPAGNFSVSIPTAERPTFAVGDMLRVHGVCSVWLVANTNRIGGFFLFTPTLAQVQVVEPAVTGATVLTQVNQVQRLRADEATSGRPVQLNGVVTFAHPDQRTFYLNDPTGGVLVWLDDRSLPLPAVGAAVRLRGYTAAGVFSACVHAGEMKVVGVQALPVPHAISLEQALTGAEDGQWVGMSGHLRQIEVNGDWLRLTLTAAAGDFSVSIPNATGFDAKAGSFLRVHGVCQPWLNKKDQIGGVFLNTPSLRDVEVAERPLDDPFAAPEEAIGNLAHYRTQTLQQQQVLVRGVVLHHVPGHYVVVANDSGVVRALCRDFTPLAPGDRVDVVGVPGREANRSVLRGAVYRRTGSGPAPAPLAPRGELKVDPALEGRLVVVTGVLVNRSSRPEDTRLMVQVGGAVLEVVFQGELPASASAAWKTDSTIAATGLYRIEYDDADQPVKFSLQLRSPADVVLRAKPPWWTARRALTGLGVIAVCLILGLGWVAALRRQVVRQTTVIRTQWEKEANLEARHGEIIANASDCIFTTNLDGRFVSFNPAGQRITGFSEGEALELRLQDLIAPEDAATGTALLGLAHSPDPASASRFEARFRTRDGRRVWMEISARLIQETGRPAGLLGVARDVTQRKHAEAEKAKLEDLRRQLEKSESLGRMAAAIAHHFNNQLQAVMMNLEMATRDRRGGTDAGESLTLAMASACKAAEVSTLMLTYLGQSRLTLEPLALAEACHAAVSRLRAVAPPGVVLDVHFPRPGPVVRANAEHIEQVLVSLVTNAWEARSTNDGTVRLALTTVAAADIPATHRYPIGCQPSDLVHACLAVADEGCGIPEEDIEKIFDPFFSRKFPGRGMGLAAALGIVRAHEGVITVASTPGRGSVFRVFLPVAGELDQPPV